MSLTESRALLKAARKEHELAWQTFKSSARKTGEAARSLDFRDLTRRHPVAGLALAAGAGLLLYQATRGGILRRVVGTGIRLGAGLVASNVLSNMEEWANPGSED